MNSDKSTRKKSTVAKKTSSRPRDVKHMDKEKVTDYSSVLNSSVKRSKLPRVRADVDSEINYGGRYVN